MMKNYDVCERLAVWLTRQNKKSRKRQKKTTNRKRRSFRARIPNTSLLYRIETRNIVDKHTTTKSKHQQKHTTNWLSLGVSQIACAFAICVDYLPNMFMHWLKMNWWLFDILLCVLSAVRYGECIWFASIRAVSMELLLLLATQRCALACCLSVDAWSNHGFARSIYTQYTHERNTVAHGNPLCVLSLSFFHSFCTHPNISIKFRCDSPTTITTATTSIAFSIGAQIDEFIFINYRLLRIKRYFNAIKWKIPQYKDNGHKSKPKQKQTPIVFGSTRGMFCRSVFEHRFSHMITSCDCLSNRAPA